MTIATLVKITAQKKLMMKITEKTYDYIHDRLTAECKKKKFPTERLATFSLENDDGEENYFVMISLDRYDKQNMRKFELLLKKDVAIQYRMKPYDFIPDGETEQSDAGLRRQGINLELISIRQIKQQNACVLPPRVDEVDKMVAARLSRKELNAEEQAIDEDVEKQVAEKLAQPRRLICTDKLQAKAVQIRKEAWKGAMDELIAEGVIESQASVATRRRRTVPAKEASLTALEAQIALEEEKL